MTQHQGAFLNQHHGAFLNKDGTTHFALWAPDARTVALELGKGDLVHNLYKDHDGWYKATIECAAGTAYRYLINNELHVPDPAARRQLDDVHGWSCVVDQAYPWKTVTWHGRPWHEAIIYELHVGALGGFSKVEEMLPTLAELGITAIELMPLNEFPGERNWGYDGVLLFAPESSYGTPEQLKSLIDSAHALDMMVIVDVVYNHFGPDGNYLGQYAKHFFRTDIKTGWGDAIDFRQQPVRDFFIENALMWILDYRVDGLRIDAAHAIKDKNFLLELSERVRGAVLPSRHVHLVLENEDNAASLLTNGFDAQWNDDGHNVLHHLLTNEHEGYYADFADSPTTKLARCLSEGFIYQGEYTPRGRLRGEISKDLPPTAFVLFLQNHDQVGNRAFGERLIQLADPDALKAAVGLLLLCPMIPLLFMGEEWGCKKPFLFFTDHHDDLAKAVCEGRRKEFESFAKFNDPEMREKIPNPNELATFTQSIPEQHDEEEHSEWREFYKGLIALRHTEIIPRLKGAKSAGVNILEDRALVASWMMGDGQLLRIYINLSIFPVHVTPSWNKARLIFSHQVLSAEYAQGILTPGSILVCIEEDARATEEDITIESLEEPAFALATS
ncbi:malto-oligosyltrehalose trehalohydrolase [Cellvibrio zantedeschiae]|uniref:Malto-oligosyltrehalose trehalohydrolase n=1 Tax=Cellvibrio zantedeschiae TaxID=1237077 RepID=A0ABQ3AZR5_9GAMM|nr:malto-oligosyltrehalose trehalohydrolase [Cellvibrio zantedeschiae]GGY71864.1 malto-oligosyltrehalose trehalohydrolase [Cellvibrio zantedeschiae]